MNLKIDLKVEQWPIERLIEYAANPRKNDDAIERMAGAIKEYGFRIPIVAKSDGLVVDGHLRLKAARKLKLKSVPVALADDLSEAQIKAFRILANKSATWADWDYDLLRVEMKGLKDEGFDLELTGFSMDELPDLHIYDGDESLEDDDDDSGEEKSSLLNLVDITIADPKTPVKLGDHFVLSDRHHLLCVGVMREHHAWSHLLVHGTIFCPYPGPFTPFGKIPKTHELVMVQPDRYVAGHILDHWIAVYGDESVKRAEE